MDDDKMKIIALNICREHYDGREAERKQEVRDMRKEVLGVAPEIHVHQHSVLTESERTKTVAKDTMVKGAANGFLSILGWLLLVGFAAWELKP